MVDYPRAGRPLERRIVASRNRDAGGCGLVPHLGGARNSYELRVK
ncbi:MAG: hypothetical protein O8C64_00345 [Candidatus Methanoperedens sp.]|nr:hypothetical protein [Candidatus Methanoperedens sp.]MCZ7405621.1 hypothetical protein [Candidatus Methanoperedens sp.]